MEMMEVVLSFHEIFIVLLISDLSFGYSLMPRINLLRLCITTHYVPPHFVEGAWI